MPHVKISLSNALSVAAPGALEKAQALRVELSRHGSSKPGSCTALARILASDPAMLADLLLVGFEGLSKACEADVSRLDAALGCAGKKPAKRRSQRELTVADHAREAIGTLLWPLYWNCVEACQGVTPAQDARLAQTLAGLLGDGLDPNARMLLREGLESSILSACLLAKAWDSALALLHAGADPNVPIQGDLGPMPPLYFALRGHDPRGGAVAAVMITQGADPCARAPSEMAFDSPTVRVAHHYRNGALLTWMIFLDHVEALGAWCARDAERRHWPDFIANKLLAMGWEGVDARALSARIERAALSIHTPSTELTPASRPTRL